MLIPRANLVYQEPWGQAKGSEQRSVQMGVPLGPGNLPVPFPLKAWVSFATRIGDEGVAREEIQAKHLRSGLGWVGGSSSGFPQLLFQEEKARRGTRARARDLPHPGGLFSRDPCVPPPFLMSLSQGHLLREAFPQPPYLNPLPAIPFTPYPSVLLWVLPSFLISRY